MTFPRSGAGTPAPDKQSVLRGYGGVLAVLLALLRVGGTVVALSSQARDQVALLFVRQPVKYTELYFSGDGPTQAGFGSDWVLVKVSFTVVYHEGERTASRIWCRWLMREERRWVSSKDHHTWRMATH